MSTPDGTIPVGFSGNDFFYKSVSAPIQINKKENEDFCELSDDELRKRITEYYNDLSFSVPGIQPKIVPSPNQPGVQYSNPFNRGYLGWWRPPPRPPTDFNITKINDEGVSDLPLLDDEKNALIEQTITYYKLVCQNKRLATELNKWLSSNIDGDIKLQDTNTNYNREYLNRINLGIGIIITCGFIYYCVTAKPAELPVPDVNVSINPSLKK